MMWHNVLLLWVCNSLLLLLNIASTFRWTLAKQGYLDEIVQALGKHGIICVEDLIHEIYTVGPHFKEANNFLLPFKLSCPVGGLKKKRDNFVESGDAGDKEDMLNSLLRQMN